MRHHLLRGIRFGITGIANTAIHAAVAYFCLNGFFTSLELIKFGPVAANAIAFILSTAFSYVVNTCWSFSGQMNRKTFGRFGVVAILGLGAAVALAKLGEFMGLPPMWGVFLVVCVMPMVNFGLHSLYTYR